MKLEVKLMGQLFKAQDKVKNIYTKGMLIRSVAEVCRKDMVTVRSIYNALEENVSKILSSASPEADVSIRLFEGITIDSTFVPEKTKVNNLTGKVIISKSKIKPRANITRNYRDKLTTYNK